MTEPDEPQPTSRRQRAVSSPGQAADPAPSEAILLDVPVVAVTLDGLGAVALFATIAAVSGAREGAVVTATVGVYVLGARMLRARRAHRAEQHRPAT